MRASETLAGPEVALPAAPSPARHGGCKNTQPPRRLPSPATQRARDLSERASCPILQVNRRGILEAVRDPSPSFALLTSVRMTVSADRDGKSAITFTTNFLTQDTRSNS